MNIRSLWGESQRSRGWISAREFPKRFRGTRGFGNSIGNSIESILVSCESRDILTASPRLGIRDYLFCAWISEIDIINRPVILFPKFLLIKPISLRIIVHGLGMRSSGLELTIHIWNQFFHGIVHHLAMLPGLREREVFVRSIETVPLPLTGLHKEAVCLIKSTT